MISCYKYTTHLGTDHFILINIFFLKIDIKKLESRPLKNLVNVILLSSFHKIKVLKFLVSTKTNLFLAKPAIALD